MDYRKFGNTILARIDKNEEIQTQLRTIAEQENIKLASIQALGALSDFTIGSYNFREKQYAEKDWHGDFEIVSLTGTITTMEDAYYCHLHMSVGDSTGNVFGGHLVRATVGATCEMVIQVLDGRVERAYDEETGLNLYKFL